MFQPSSLFRTAILIVALVLGLGAGNAGAVTITIDPGPVGTEHTASFQRDFDDLNGMPITGTLSLEFVFDGMKHLEMDHVPDSSWFTVQLSLFQDIGSFTAILSGSSGYAADENGVSVLPSQISRNGSANVMGAALLLSAQDPEAADGVVYHSVLYDILLPDLPANTITGGRIQYQVPSLPVFPGPFNKLIVGEWTVPEPSSLALVTCALLGFVAWRRPGIA